MFAILLGVSICITLHFGQCSTERFKFVSYAEFAVTMQVCTFSHKIIYFNRTAISCNSGPYLHNMLPVCVFSAAPISEDTQLACAALLHITSAIQPTIPHYNSLHTALVLHNSTTGSIVYGQYQISKIIDHYYSAKLKHNLSNPPIGCSFKATAFLIQWEWSVFQQYSS